MIERFGRTITINKKTTGTYDPDDGSFVGKSETGINVKSVVRSYTSREIDGKLIQVGDKEFLIAHASITDQDATFSAEAFTDYEITDDGVYNIENVSHIKTGDTALVYKVQARK